MQFKQLVALATVLPLAMALAPPLIPRQDEPPTESPITLGPDTPTDSATIGYNINAITLNTNNLTRSIEWYRDVFGMRHMFTYKATDILSVALLGHSAGGRNHSAYQTTQELIRFKNNEGGKMELIALDAGGGGDGVPASDTVTTTFNHLAFSVPDSQAAQDRIERMGLPIYKKIGEPWPSDGPIGSPFALGDGSQVSDEQWDDIRTAMSQVNSALIYLPDPDGNLVKIIPLNDPMAR
jgi:lactoylglutathione lyase